MSRFSPSSASGRPLDVPAEAAAERTHADDRLRAPERVRRIVLPRGNPLEHRIEHLVHPQERVLATTTLAERGVDEVAASRDPQPDRAEVAEHDLLLSRLPEDAEVGHPAVRDEIPRPG